MRKQLSRPEIGLSLFVGLALLAGGCSPSGSTGSQAKDTGKDKKGQVVRSDDKKDGSAKHGAWWCGEHGIPEAECSMCSAKAAADFKKKGDWCDKHDRAMSQCFICDPKLKEKYASVYRAKYGKEPPPTEDEEMAKEGEKK